MTNLISPKWHNQEREIIYWLGNPHTLGRSSMIGPRAWAAPGGYSVSGSLCRVSDLYDRFLLMWSPSAACAVITASNLAEKSLPQGYCLVQMPISEPIHPCWQGIQDFHWPGLGNETPPKQEMGVNCSRTPRRGADHCPRPNPGLLPAMLKVNTGYQQTALCIYFYLSFAFSFSS